MFNYTFGFLPFRKPITTVGEFDWKEFSEYQIVIQHRKQEINAILFSLFFLFSFPLPVGKPIEVERNENPSREQVEALHKKYTDALTSLFEEFNPIHGRKNARLEIY